MILSKTFPFLPFGLVSKISNHFPLPSFSFIQFFFLRSYSCFSFFSIISSSLYEKNTFCIYINLQCPLFARLYTCTTNMLRNRKNNISGKLLSTKHYRPHIPELYPRPWYNECFLFQPSGIGHSVSSLNCIHGSCSLRSRCRAEMKLRGQ